MWKKQWLNREKCNRILISKTLFNNQKTDTLTHSIDQFLSDEIKNIVKKLSESSNNLELSQSLILAKELFNNLNTSQATAGDHQAQLIQDLNSSLLTLQLVALESVEQPDPIASKEALYKILDVAESLATKLDPLLSSTHQDTGLKNETKLQECEPDKTQVLNKEENAEPDTSQTSLQQTNVDTKTYINKDTDNPRGSAEQSSEIDTTSTARGEILESLLIESAKTVMIPVVGNVLSEDLPSVLELLTPDVSVVNSESSDIPLGGFIEVFSGETQTMEIKEDTMLNIKTEQQLNAQLFAATAAKRAAEENITQLNSVKAGETKIGNYRKCKKIEYLPELINVEEDIAIYEPII
ncbi:hypothetical protein HW555_008995 [Spodoptera exigua]|uniref:Uncharacterized protein n=1 Tax=Spodoptera exigua TaxID=7107 RepID=A0A835L3Y5_SPOEX|nr:hypothetical protein HW555_008995 [Spodoptera exigua]